MYFRPQHPGLAHATPPHPPRSATNSARSHLLGRLRRQIDLTADPVLAKLYDELRGYPCDQPEPELEPPGADAIVMPLCLRHGGRELAFFSTVTTFGTPLDITVAELAIESFFPADDRTAAVLRAGRTAVEGTAQTADR